MTIDTTLVRKPGEELTFNHRLYSNVGIGLAKSMEEMQACLRYLSALDFRIQVVDALSIDVWVNKDDYIAIKTKELDADKQKDLGEAAAAWFGVIVAVFLQTLISSGVLAGAAKAANYFFNLSIDVWAVFNWAALVVGILSVITNLLSQLTRGK